MQFAFWKNKYNNVGCIVWDLIIGMTYWLRGTVLKSHGWIYKSSKIFYNRFIVGIELKFLKIKW